WQLAGCVPLEPSAAIRRAALLRPAAGLGRLSASPQLGRLLRWVSSLLFRQFQCRPSAVSLHQIDESAAGLEDLRSGDAGKDGDQEDKGAPGRPSVSRSEW